MSIEDTNDIVHGQFVRIQTYARVASKKAQQLETRRQQPRKGRKNGLELVRCDFRGTPRCRSVWARSRPAAACLPLRHRSQDARPRKRARRVADAIQKRTGKKPRKDTSHLLAGVLSYPDDAPKGDRYDEWRDRSIKWLQKRYGTHLVAVLEHQDEANPHLHWYCIEPEGLDVKRLHEGWTAKKDGQEYRAAMRLVQDDYHRDVGSYVGLLRIGPGVNVWTATTTKP